VCVFDGAPARLHFYNHRRAHSALGGLPPISRLPDLPNLPDLPDLPGRHSEVTTSERKLSMMVMNSLISRAGAPR